MLPAWTSGVTRRLAPAMKKTTQVNEALIRLLTEMEAEEDRLVLQERWKAERNGL